MMGSYSGAEEEQFFDARDEITSVSDLGSDCSDYFSSEFVNYGSKGFGYEFWSKKPESVLERRQRFFKWMGLSSDWHLNERDESWNISHHETKIDINRIKDDSGAVLANSDYELKSSVSSQSNEALEVVEDGLSEENLLYKIRNLDDGTEFVVDELDQDGTRSRFRQLGSSQVVTVEEFHRTLDSSSLVQQLLQREETEPEVANVVDTKGKVKRGWLQKLGIRAHIVDRKEGASSKPNDINTKAGARIQRVRVHSYRKRLKELSALHTEQEFPAHEGSILTMKFSPDGQYLASAGEDGIVRVWKVIEDEKLNTFNIQDADPSCFYLSLNRCSKLVPLDVGKEKTGKMKRLKKSSESACVIFPPKIFRILEKAVHEFHGHSGEVLALSWSKNGYLLSSSVDKTVRLWQVGCDRCLRIFSHNNYVTCVEFNPMDDNYFVSGSIDGKVRIWQVYGCKVVDWTDIREIVTAVCYCPNGKGGIVGSMDGNCRFYDIIDNRLELRTLMCLQGKKKLPGKRITGFQFFPGGKNKVMVTSADSQIRILCGNNVVRRFRGIRNSSGQISASFTSDGKHIISATENSNVYIWNYANEDLNPSRVKNIWSSESFLSHNASVAIPWCGMKSMSGPLPSPTFMGDEDLHNKMPLSSPDCFSLSGLESLHRGAATWPEEQLPNSSPVQASPSICKSEYKFLKSACQSKFNSHMWGLVIVTAGWDGRIRTFLNYGLPIRL